MTRRNRSLNQFLIGMFAAAMGIGCGARPAHADSTTAYCVLSRHDHTIPLEKGPCQFSQRQGNVNVRFKDWAFRFDADDNGLTYQRQATADGLRFNREGHYTLMVYWQQPKP